MSRNYWLFKWKNLLANVWIVIFKYLKLVKVHILTKLKQTNIQQFMIEKKEAVLLFKSRGDI